MSTSLAIDITSSLRFECTFARKLCTIIDSPRSLTVALLIEYEEWQQLVDLGIDPSHYEDASNFADDYLVTEILQKSSNLPLGIDRYKVALDDFWSSEARCRTTNDRLMDSSNPEPETVHRARRLLHRTLGQLTRKDLEFVQDNFRFGPGATTGVRGSGSVLSDKYDEEIHLTRELIPFYRGIIGDRWWDYKFHPVVVDGNRFTTVPKSAKKDRGICIEPTLNIYAQLGVGALLRARLSRLGIDLTTQERNQQLAKDAYSKNLATIDLSAASDSMSWGCVLSLLPSDWFELLDLLRSPYSAVEGESVELEKFSSMGNGFTFELETLIFSAVAFSSVAIEDHHLVSVYGDDIIVPQYAATEVIETLEYLGFSVNTKKSFLAGNFFESCGTDWFKSQNVRPFYLRQDTDSKIPYPVQVANALRLYASRRMGGLCCDVRFRSLWNQVYKLIPPAWKRAKVPVEFGDSGVIVALHETRYVHAMNGIEGWAILHMRMVPIQKRKRTLGLLLSKLDGFKPDVVPRGISPLLSAIACPVTEVASYGREPKRGYLGNPVPKWTICYKWSEGLDWCL